MPSDKFHHSAIALVSARSVFAALQRSETWKGIGPIDEVWDATHADRLLTGFRWSARAAGRTWEGTARRSAWEPDRSMTLDLESTEVAGKIEVELEATESDTTRIEVTMEARSTGLLSGMFWGVVATAIGKGLPKQVEAFAHAVSS